MYASVFEKDQEFGIEIADAKDVLVAWQPLGTLNQEQTLQDHLLLHGFETVGKWNLRNKVSRIQLKWAVQPATVLGVVSPPEEDGPVEFIE